MGALQRVILNLDHVDARKNVVKFTDRTSPVKRFVIGFGGAYTEESLPVDYYGLGVTAVVATITTQGEH